MPTQADAEAFIAASDFRWHQAFELVPGLLTPGVSSVPFLLDQSRMPIDLRGRSVLDVGTTNGGTAFALEARGADRVVAVDIVDGEHFGFFQIRDFLSSSVEFEQCSVYELSSVLTDTFDVVICWGLLYHLRHPLLALDELRRVTRGMISIETAIADALLPTDLRDQPLVMFFRRDELAGDASNWSAPTTQALVDWVTSCGFEVERSDAWHAPDPTRAMVNAAPTNGDPEYQRVSYERPLRARVTPG